MSKSNKKKVETPTPTQTPKLETKTEPPKRSHKKKVNPLGRISAEIFPLNPQEDSNFSSVEQ